MEQILNEKYDLFIKSKLYDNNNDDNNNYILSISHNINKNDIITLNDLVFAYNSKKYDLSLNYSEQSKLIRHRIKGNEKFNIHLFYYMFNNFMIMSIWLCDATKHNFPENINYFISELIDILQTKLCKFAIIHINSIDSNNIIYKKIINIFNCICIFIPFIFIRYSEYDIISINNKDKNYNINKLNNYILHKNNVIYYKMLMPEVYTDVCFIANVRYLVYLKYHIKLGNNNQNKILYCFIMYLVI